jgi:hypothetical protein
MRTQPAYTHDDFDRLLAAAFPELREEVED